MGAFKNKTKHIFLSEMDKTYFFSTDAFQNVDYPFAPITFYTVSVEEIKEDCEDHGYIEIDNPDPDFKP